MLDKLDAALDVQNLTPVKRSTEMRCLQAEKVTVYGFADCHESPASAAERAERIRDDFPDAGVLVDKSVEDPADNATAEDPAATDPCRSRLSTGSPIVSIWRAPAPRPVRPAKLTGSYDEDLIAMVESPQGEGSRTMMPVSGHWGSGGRQRDRLPGQGGCADSDAWPWKDGRKAVGEALTTTVDAEQACSGGADVGSEQLLSACVTLWDEPAERLGRGAGSAAGAM